MKLPTLIMPAQMLPVTRRADGSVTIKLVSSLEVDTEQFAAIDSYRQTHGWFAFQADEMDGSELPKTKSIENDQTPSQQLRNALWWLHRKRGGHENDWPKFYERSMEKIRMEIIEQMG